MDLKDEARAVREKLASYESQSKELAKLGPLKALVESLEEMMELKS